ncbi:MAG: tRNA 2-thiouridine(34) synthase MnmA [Candidatus Aminicenantes bacterium]|nr:tRNA 2-thiouridine(34) synthase MnmA [Candidatus Aminicenantes bacterium]
MKKEKVAVALSGGVDSSLAAVLLLKKGYEIIGVTLDLLSYHEGKIRGSGRKKAVRNDVVEEAEGVARYLGIPFRVIVMREPFHRLVVDAFVEEYAAGRTPNPCILCNQAVKFGLLWDRVQVLGVKKLATGHHARIDADPRGGIFRLRKGLDRDKDQSYFLYRLSREQLSRSLMPVGELTKEQVRKTAEETGLPAARRPESQEICFIPENDYAAFLSPKIPSAFKPGPIKDRYGRVLGRHKGIAFYTVGQRRGLGIAAPEPLYVVAMDPQKNIVFVGPRENLYRRTLTASHVCWTGGIIPKETFHTKAKIRSQHKEADAEVFPLGKEKVKVKFVTAQRAVAPGQSVVFYDGDMVLGGGLID